MTRAHVLVAALALATGLTACGNPVSASPGSSVPPKPNGAGCFSPGMRPFGPSGASGAAGIQRPAAAGTVASTGSATFTVQGRQGTVTVTYDPSTKFSGASSVATGDRVTVQGTRQPDGSVKASAVTVRPAGAGLPSPGAGRPRPCGPAAPPG